MLAANVLIIIYLIIATSMMALAKVKHHHRHIFYGINALILVWNMAPFLAPIASGFLQGLYDWSPLIFLPILHRETELITKATGARTYDSLFISLDEKYCPYIMDLHRNNRANSKTVSELLHLCYFSFYALIYGVPLYFYLRQEFSAFYQSVFVMLLLLFSCYITHGLIPVCGPRNIFAKICDHRSEGFFFRLVHKVLEDGSTHGTAFPSGHTGIAGVVLLMTWHLHTTLFYCILPIAVGLIVSTIYGRFHYVTDVLFGLLYAFLAFFITTLVYS